MAYFDIGYGNWLPTEVEEIVVETCASCGEDLLAGQEVVTDGNGNYWCDCDCALKNLDFEHVEQDGYEAILCDGVYYEDLSDLQSSLFESEILEADEEYYWEE